jgi:hypothetical protein
MVRSFNAKGRPRTPVLGRAHSTRGLNSSEKRLVRVLLLLARFGKDGKPEVSIPKISQRDAGRNGGNDSLASQLLHEQIPEVGIHRL